MGEQRNVVSADESFVGERLLTGETCDHLVQPAAIRTSLQQMTQRWGVVRAQNRDAQ
jgi:hypothetical protein